MSQPFLNSELSTLQSVDLVIVSVAASPSVREIYASVGQCSAVSSASQAFGEWWSSPPEETVRDF